MLNSNITTDCHWCWTGLTSQIVDISWIIRDENHSVELIKRLWRLEMHCFDLWTFIENVIELLNRSNVLGTYRENELITNSFYDNISKCFCSWNSQYEQRHTRSLIIGILLRITLFLHCWLSCRHQNEPSLPLLIHAYHLKTKPLPTNSWLIRSTILHQAVCSTAIIMININLCMCKLYMMILEAWCRWCDITIVSTAKTFKGRWPALHFCEIL